LWAYEGIAKKIIHKAKYKLYYDVLSELIINNNDEKLELTKFNEFLSTRPIIVPVPLHPKREFERGFNQSNVIAGHLSQIWKLELKDLLVRIKDTGHQTNRNRQERLTAVKNAFVLRPKICNLSTNVLLVDDVWTTGATMSECCRVIKTAGVKTVWGIVLAR